MRPLDYPLLILVVSFGVSGIPFIKIANRVEVAVNLKGQRISGPPLALKE